MSHLGSAIREGTPSVEVVKACIKGIVYPLGTSLLSQSQSALIPKPEVAFSRLAHAQCPSCLHTCDRENHKGYLCGHLHEVRRFHNASLPVSIPLDEVPQNNLDCGLPDEDVIALSEAWSCDSSMLSPLLVLSGKDTWAIYDVLIGFS